MSSPIAGQPESACRLSADALEVLIAPAALRELRADYAARGENTCGLLLGEWSPPDGEICCTVVKCMPLDASVSDLRVTLENWPASLAAPVGVYKYYTGGPQRFYFYELRDVHEYFRAPGDVAVCIYRGMAGARGYVVAGLKGSTELAHTSFDLAAPLGQTSAPAESAAAPAPGGKNAAATPQQPAPQLRPTGPVEDPSLRFETLAETPGRPRALPVGRAAIALLLVLLSAAAWWLWKPQTERPPSSDPASAGAATDSVNLRVARRGGDLEISWNGQSPLLKSAQGGFLYITDGGERKDIFLEDIHLRTGRVLYAPTTLDLDVRLELMMPGQRFHREALRVFQGAAPRQLRAEPQAASRQRSSSAEEPSATRSEEAEDTRPQAKAFVPPSLPVGAIRLETDPAPDVTPSGAITAGPSQPVVTADQLARVAPPQPVAENVAPAASRLRPTPPVPLRQYPVIIPPDVRARMRLTDVVTVPVNVDVDENGRVTSARADAEAGVTGFRLSAIAVSTAKLWQFTPGTYNGKPTRGQYTIVFRFRP